MADKKVVMISSTARDLPKHREQVMDACLRQSMFPVMMEHLPAGDDDAIKISLSMIDEADIYVGVFAHRYGYIPSGHDISVSEMEYNRAVEKGIPRLIFNIDKTHPLGDFTIADIDTGESSVKLRTFKDRLEKENIVNFFKSPEDLRAHVINSLSKLREVKPTEFHYVSDIPKPPEVYIAHPYTLMQSRQFVGRQAELSMLTDWVAKPESGVYQARIFNFVAIGGMGKSALAWKWFNDVAPQEMKPLAGPMWWSFYESDATFENFIIRALAYVTGRSREDIEKNTKPGEREEQLFSILDRQPFLLVLDGLERILIAYSRMDAGQLNDSQVGSQKSVRKTSDPRAGSFLKRLAHIKQSRILVSTRLYPAELETDGGDPVPSSYRYEVQGLTDEDAVGLWRAFGVSGSRDELLPVFSTFGKHPLLIQALAGEIKRYHRAPSDFEAWREANPSFDPARFPRLQEAMAHVLEFALRGLDAKERKVLHTIAVFRMPANYGTLAALLAGEDKVLINENALDVVLIELEDRGLMGWDRPANRYDLHPIVRGVVWSGLDDATRKDLYGTLETYFEAVPTVDENDVNSLEDLTPVIELYNTLIGLERYQDAWYLYRSRLFSILQFRFSMTVRQVEFLKMLFPNGLESEPALPDTISQSQILRVLGESYHRGGQPKQAADCYLRCIGIKGKLSLVAINAGMSVSTGNNLISHLQMLGDALYLTGKMYESGFVSFLSLNMARRGFDHWHQAIVLSRIGLLSAARGNVNLSINTLKRSLVKFNKMQSKPREGGVHVLLAQLRIWSGDFGTALSLADRAWESAYFGKFERDFVRASRVQGTAFLCLDDRMRADERLHHALARARTVNFAEEELPALVALAELRRRQGDHKAARDLLDDVWEAAERGPYPLFHADALNVLAQIERDAGNKRAGIDAATEAYQKAWCDGPPFAYHWGLEKAKAHLKALDAPEPDMPPFDESKYEPMPEVEIDPPDEFGEKEGD